MTTRLLADDRCGGGYADAEAETHNATLEKLVSDTQSTALLTATITSIVNALIQPGVARTRIELQAYLPNTATLTVGVASLNRETGLSVMAYGAISPLFSSLAAALRETDRYFADIELIGVERAVTLHQFSLAKLWRRASADAAAAVSALCEEAGETLPELYFLSNGILQRVLGAAAMGESPGIDRSGKPYLPTLPQRRRSARRMLGQAGVAVSGGRLLRVFVRDVSQGGMGLEQASNLPASDLVTIELETGRRFSGTIVWRRGLRAGFKFNAPLSPNDPLLWG